MKRVDLIPHPQSRVAATVRVEADVEAAPDGRLTLRYRVTGDIGQIRLPPPTAAARANALWRETCFEAFLRAAPGDGYYEFNFAPSTQWAAYRFSAYREGMTVAGEVSPPAIKVTADASRLELQAAINISDLSFAPCNADWRLGLSAIIEEKSGAKSYWALAHPPGAPDFHHSDCFAHELAWEIPS